MLSRAEIQKRWRKRHPEKKKEQNRRWRMKRDYGITPEYYDELGKIQGGVCAICEKPCITGKRLAIDHCHETHKVRGLLCVNCNRAIGHLKDSPTLAVKVAEYLRQD